MIIACVPLFMYRVKQLDEAKAEKQKNPMRRIEQDGHYYMVLSDDTARTNAVVHDPDCKCKK